MTDPAPTTAPRVLILDDEPIILMDLGFALEDAGAKVLDARSVAEALELIERQTPDAAILDVNLGQGSTCAPVALRLRELGVPFVLHTGDLDRQGELVETLGAPVIPKPSSGPEVVRKALALMPSHAPATG